MFTYQINYTIETENEISENVLGSARDMGGQAISNAVEELGGEIP